MDQSCLLPDDAHASSIPSGSLPLTIIEPPRGFAWFNLGEIWNHRELLYFFVWRDIKVRYKQTALGIAWAVLQPLALMVIFTLVLGRIAPTKGLAVPYPLFVFAGLISWNLFATALNSSANSLVDSERLITKVYFPRLLIPLGAIGPAIIDFCLNCLALACLLAWYRIPPATSIIGAPLAVISIVAAVVGMGSLLAALNVAYRDFRYTLTFLLQAWMFATPAIYLPTGDFSPETARESQSIASSAAQWLEVINPLNGSIRFFRAAVLGDPLPWLGLASAVVGSLMLLMVGLIVFRRTEDSFADII